MKRAIGIVRVSRVAGRDGDKFHSPEIQREHIERDCARFGLELTDVFEELDVSGGKPIAKRPGLSKALSLVENGRAEAIVFAYRDRMDRSIESGSELCKRMDANDALLLAAGRQITHSTHDGWRMATLESFLNEDQRRAVAAKVRDVHVGNLKAGVAPYMIRVGYRRREDGVAEIDPVKGPLILEAFTRRAAGQSTTDICRWLGEHGIKLSIGGLLRALESRWYLGELHFGKKHEPNLAAHEPLVTPELFDAVQAQRGAARGRRAESPSLLARLGVLKCRGCEGRMSVSHKTGGTHTFYRCNTVGCAAPVAINASVVEPQVIKETLTLCKGLTGSATRESRVVEAKAAWDRADAALTRLLRLLTAAEAQDEPEAVEQIRAAREARNAAKLAYDNELEADAGARLAITAEDVFEHGTLEEKRELIAAVVDTVWVKRGRTKAARAERVEVVGKTL